MICAYVIAVLLVVPVFAFGNQPPEVTIIRINETTETGRWDGSPDGKHVRLQTADGERNIPLQDLARIIFQPAADRTGDGFQGRERNDRDDAGAAQLDDWEDIPFRAVADEKDGDSPTTVFYLADGGRLYGELLGVSDRPDSLLARTALGESAALEFRALAGVRLTSPQAYPRAAEMFRSTLKRRPPGGDVLITRNEDDVRVVPARLVSLDARRGVFALGDRERTILSERLFGVVFAAGASQKRPAHSITVRLRDGSMFSGRLEPSDSDVLAVATSLGISAHLSLSAVERVDVRSERVVYVSDLTPRVRRVEGLLHVPWAVMWDRNVSGGPIRMDGRIFEKGIGVHSRTELSFPLDGAYESFVATIGLDDSVRPRGSVEFLVLGDDRELFRSGVVRGTDPSQLIVADVSGVEVLTLVVEYADDLDLSDHANWGAARLLKPAATIDEGT